MRTLTPRWGAVAPLFFTSCALAYFVLPLTEPFGRVLIGTAVFAPDAVLNAGILEWGFRSLWSGQLFEWNAGFPLHNMLAGTENLVGWQLFYTPLRTAGAGVVATYNILMVGSFIVSALGAQLLARRFGADRWGACAAGVVFAFTPFHVEHALHLQTMAVCWSPFAVYFLDRLLQRPNARDWIGLVATFTMSLLSGMYVGIFLGGFLCVYTVLVWVVRRARFQWRMAGLLVSAAGASFLLTLPVLLRYVRFNAEYGFFHPIERLIASSLAVIDLVRAPSWLATWAGTWVTDGAATGMGAFPGLVALTLVACFCALRTRETNTAGRAAGLIFGSLALFALLFALGPVLKVRGNYPSRVSEWVPLPGRLFIAISAIRSPLRIMIYAFLFGSVLAGLGLSRVLGRVQPRWRQLLAAAILMMLVVEFRPASWYSTRAARLAPPLELSGAYRFLAAETDRGGVIELPLADSARYATPMRARYTYASSGHLRRVVAFHGSIRPPVLDSLERSATRLPQPGALRVLANFHVTRLVVHRDLMSGAEEIVNSLRAGGYEVLYDEQDAVVFALSVPRASPSSAARDTTSRAGTVPTSPPK